jgi:hypothetical protein
MKTDPTIEEVRKARQQISRECGDDARRLVDYYQRLQSEERESTPAKVLKARRLGGKTMGAKVALEREWIARAVRADRDAR